MENRARKVQLVHLDGPFKGEIQDYLQPVVAIGRHPDCQLVFPKECETISRMHAEIQREGQRFKFIDHSSNGTLVNGRPQKEVFLKDGDVLIIGGEGGPKVSFLSAELEPGDEAALAAVQKKVQVEEVIKVASTPVKQQSVPKIQKTPQPVQPSPSKPEPIPQVIPEPSPDIPPAPVNKSFVIQYGATLTSYKQLPISIGSGSESDCVLQHPDLLPQHAQIFFRDGSYWVKDLTGRGLLLVNERPVSGEAELIADCSLALSVKGPKFRFLGEGRLAEIEQKQSPSLSTKQSKRQHVDRPESSRKGASKGFFWLLLLVAGGAAIAAAWYFLSRQGISFV